MARSEPIVELTLSQPSLNATFMGVILGTAQHFNTGLTGAEYYAESGYAFAVNIHPDLCPSGPYCWNHVPILNALRQLGIDGGRLEFDAFANTFEDRCAIAERVQAGFKQGVVSMEGLEHQLIVECDSENMTFAMPWTEAIDSCMRELSWETWCSQKEPPPFGFYRFSASDVAPKEQRVLQAIKVALAVYDSPSEFEIEDYKFGPNAYAQWCDALQNPESDKHGQWWNCTVWSECRRFAAEYYHAWPLGPNVHASQLASIFKQSSDLMLKASPHDLSNEKKIDLIRQVETLEKQVPTLLRSLESDIA